MWNIFWVFFVWFTDFLVDDKNHIKFSWDGIRSIELGDYDVPLANVILGFEFIKETENRTDFIKLKPFSRIFDIQSGKLQHGVPYNRTFQSNEKSR